MDSVGMFSQTFFCVIDVLVLPREWGNWVWLLFVSSFSLWLILVWALRHCPFGKQNSPAYNEVSQALTMVLWWKAAWEVCWTSWPHTPPQHIDPHHVTKECSSSFVLTSMALIGLRAILHTIEWSLAWHFASPFSFSVIIKQDLWAALSCIF